MFINGIKNIDNNFDSIPIIELSRILGTISTIFGRADEQNKVYDHEIYRKEYDKLSDLFKKLNAHLKFQAQYDGADSINKILPYYLRFSSFSYLSSLSASDFGKYMEQAVSLAQIGGPETNPNIVNECRNIYYAVDRFLSTSIFKNALIDRLITYCTWIKRNEFAKTKVNKEFEISKILEEFIFNNGYFPIVNFKMGDSIPDILINPVGANVSWDNSVLIELKQSLGKKYTPMKFKSDIGQAHDYLKLVKSVKPDLADTVYLLIFYDGNKRLPDKSLLLALDSIPESVKVEFIYVGEKSPSKLIG